MVIISFRVQISALIAFTLAILPALSPAQVKLATKWSNQSMSSPTSLAYSPDGTLLAVGSISGVKVITLATGTAVSFPTSSSGGVKSVAFSHDGKSLAVGGLNLTTVAEGGVLEVWTLATGKATVLATTASYGVFSVAFSPDNKTLASGGLSYNFSTAVEAGVVELWTLASGKSSVLKTSANLGVDSLAFSPNGATLADGGASYNYISGEHSATLELWTLATGKVNTLSSNASLGIASLAYSPDGTTVAVGGQNESGGVLELWNVSNGNATTLITPSFGVSTLAYSPDGKSLAEGSLGIGSTGQPAGLLEIWDLATQSVTILPTTIAYDVWSVAFSPNGAALADGGITLSTNYGGLEGWNLSTLKLAQDESTASKVSIPALAFSHDGQSVVGFYSGSYHPAQASILQIWNSATGAATQSVKMSSVGSVAYSPDDQTVAAFGSAGLQLWSLADSKTSTYPTSINWTYGPVIYSPDGTTIVDCGQAYDLTSNQFSGVVELWSVASGSSRLLGTAANQVTAIAYSPNGALFADGGIGDSGGIVEIWNASTGSMVRTLASSASYVTSIAISVDGQTLACGGYSEDVYDVYYPVLELWNISTGKLIKSLPIGADDAVKTVAFSRDGTTLFAGTFFQIIAFGTATDALLGSYQTGTVSAMAVSPDTTTVAYTTSNGELVTVINPFFTAGWLQGVFASSSSVLGGTSLTGTVTLGAPAPLGGEVVMLSATAPATLSHASVTVPQGATTATFPIATSAVSASKVATIKATYKSASVTATVSINPPSLASISVSASTVVGGVTVTGNVTLSAPAPAGGLKIALNSNSSSASISTSITVPAGKTSASISVKTLPVSVQTGVVITATFGGSSESASLTVNPPVLSSLTLSPTTVAPGKTSTATVHIGSAAPSVGLIVSISSSSTAVTLPKTVTIPGGKTSVTFAIKAVTGSGKTTATINVANGIITKSAVLTVS